jgi:hypothetical protein
MTETWTPPTRWADLHQTTRRILQEMVKTGRGYSATPVERLSLLALHKAGLLHWTWIRKSKNRYFKFTETGMAWAQSLT